MAFSQHWIGLANAQTAGGGAQGPGFLATVVPLILIFAIFYFLIIRPQSKRMKEHRQMVQNLAKGDQVVTGGGLHGQIVRVSEDTVTVELAEGVRVKAQRDTIQSVLSKETDQD